MLIYTHSQGEQQRREKMNNYKDILETKIIIKTEADFTPKGKRAAKIVRTRKGKKLPRPVIAWYVGGRFYKHTFDAKLTNEWLAA